MNTHPTTAQTVRRTLGACAAIVTVLVGLAQPQIAAAQTEISASIAPAQRYRAPDNGSAAVTIAAASTATDRQQVQPAGAADLPAANVQAADRAFALQAADRMFARQAADRMFARQAADRVFARQAADRAFALQAADRMFARQAAERVFARQAAERVFARQGADRLINQ